MEKFLEKEEFNKLQELNNKYNQNLYDLGIITNEINQYEDYKAKLLIESKNICKDLETIKGQNDNFLKELENKYGKVSIDINTGEIN